MDEALALKIRLCRSSGIGHIFGKCSGWLGILLSILAILLTHHLAGRVFEFLPHLEDEMAYTWQAKAYAGGALTVPTPVDGKSFIVPFVVDYGGQRFSKYPPGWSMLLSLGVRLGMRDWVNPLLAGLTIWLIYRLGARYFSPPIGLLSAALTLTSPFFLLNSASLLSHPWSLVLTLAFVAAWLDLFFGDEPSPGRAALLGLLAGLSLGALAITRPLTAVGIALPFIGHGLYLLLFASPRRRLWAVGIAFLVLVVSALLPLWQYAVTGDPWLNPYTLWWPYDKVGFGEGYGRQKGGHSLFWAWVNLRVSLNAGAKDLFGWGSISWLFLPFGLAWWLQRPSKTPRWLLFSLAPALILVYMAYWIGAQLFGPRYYYEALASLVWYTAAGLAWFFEHPPAGLRPFLRPALALLMVTLVGYNFLLYLPQRLEEMEGLYGIRRAYVDALIHEPSIRTPALIFIRIQKTWTEYGTFLDLEDPWLTSPYIFAMARGSADQKVMDAFPERYVYRCRLERQRISCLLERSLNNVER
ncbi:MAG: glycosyltransferase family 39 protein [Anaerolineales bacterium]